MHIILVRVILLDKVSDAIEIKWKLVLNTRRRGPSCMPVQMVVKTRVLALLGAKSMSRYDP